MFSFLNESNKPIYKNRKDLNNAIFTIKLLLAKEIIKNNLKEYYPEYNNYYTDINNYSSYYSKEIEVLDTTPFLKGINMQNAIFIKENNTELWMLVFIKKYSSINIKDIDEFIKLTDIVCSCKGINLIKIFELILIILSCNRIDDIIDLQIMSFHKKIVNIFIKNKNILLSLINENSNCGISNSIGSLSKLNLDPSYNKLSKKSSLTKLNINYKLLSLETTRKETKYNDMSLSNSSINNSLFFNNYDKNTIIYTKVIKKNMNFKIKNENSLNSINSSIKNVYIKKCPKGSINSIDNCIVSSKANTTKNSVKSMTSINNELSNYIIPSIDYTEKIVQEKISPEIKNTYNRSTSKKVCYKSFKLINSKELNNSEEKEKELNKIVISELELESSEIDINNISNSISSYSDEFSFFKSEFCIINNNYKNFVKLVNKDFKNKGLFCVIKCISKEAKDKISSNEYAIIPLKSSFDVIDKKISSVLIKEMSTYYPLIAYIPYTMRNQFLDFNKN